MQRVIDGWNRLQSDVWITPLETVSLMSSGQQFYWRQPLARTACLQVMMTDTRHRVIDRPIKTLRHQSAGLQKCSMKAGQSLFSLFAHSPAHATRGSRLATRGSRLAARGSRLAARGSRLEYRTRFLAAPPAGILEQKRDCSQFALRSLSRPRYSRLAARDSRLAARGSRLAARGSNIVLAFSPLLRQGF